MVAFPRFGALALASAVLAASPTAWAQAPKTAAPPAKAAPPPVGADPAATSATYGDWVLRCQQVTAGDKTQRICEVAQTLQMQGQQTPVAQIAFGRVVSSDPLRLTVAVPPNIALPGSVAMSVSDQDPAPLQLAWRRCLPGFCVADAAPGPDILKAFRAATTPGRLLFKDAAGRDVPLPFSFRGLAPALDALAKG